MRLYNNNKENLGLCTANLQSISDFQSMVHAVKPTTVDQLETNIRRVIWEKKPAVMEEMGENLDRKNGLYRRNRVK